jgi:hypothetical protein
LPDVAAKPINNRAAASSLFCGGAEKLSPESSFTGSALSDYYVAVPQVVYERELHVVGVR